MATQVDSITTESTLTDCECVEHQLPYSTYYKPMGDLPYISSEQGGGLMICTELICEYNIYKCPIPIQELRAEEGGGLIIHHGMIIRTIW